MGTTAICLALVVAFGQPAEHHDFAKFLPACRGYMSSRGSRHEPVSRTGPRRRIGPHAGKGSLRDAKPSAVTVQSPTPRDTETPGADRGGVDTEKSVTSLPLSIRS